MDRPKAHITYTEDDSYVLHMIAALEHNDGYCPCKTEKNKDTKCMCKEFRDKIARGEAGICHCGLYKVDF